MPSGPLLVDILNTEEKGSDVNLATLLLCDGITKDYEVAVVISNDSDLVMPIEVVRSRLGFPIGVLNPHQTPSYALIRAASFYRPIREGVLRISQFPPTLTDAVGTITKPAGW